MENFVYCNNCFRSKHSSTVLFHVTSCRHVYCDACKDECTQDTCKICGAPCSTVALSHDMAPAFHELFQDPENIRRRAYMACEFQNSQLVRLCKQQELKLAKLQNKYFKAVGCWIKRCRRYNAVAEEAADLRAKLRDERAKRQPSSGPSTSRVSVKMDSRGTSTKESKPSLPSNCQREDRPTAVVKPFRHVPPKAGNRRGMVPAWGQPGPSRQSQGATWDQPGPSHQSQGAAWDQPGPSRLSTFDPTFEPGPSTPGRSARPPFE